MKKRYIAIPVGIIAAFMLIPAPAKADIGGFFENLFSTALGGLQADLNEYIASTEFGDSELGQIALELTGEQGIITPDNIKSLAKGETGPLLESGENLLSAKLTGLISEQVLGEKGQEHQQKITDAAADNTQVASQAEKSSRSENAKVEGSSISQNIFKGISKQLVEASKQNTALISAQEIATQQQNQILQQGAAANLSLQTINGVLSSEQQQKRELEQAAAEASTTRSVFEAGLWGGS